ncbi:hypothetical protein FJ251_12540 [bacterium]|nr:hypothetical protein [bacterium]
MDNARLLWEIAFLLGDLGQDLTGDARTETIRLLEALEADPLPEPALQEASLRALGFVLHSLLGGSKRRGQVCASVLWSMYDAIYTGDPARLYSHANIGPPR